MDDKEKVIKGLKQHRDGQFHSCDNCPYVNDTSCQLKLYSDALALLEEQEKRINELEEKLRLLEYGDQDTLESGLRPAT